MLFGTPAPENEHLSAAKAAHLTLFGLVMDLTRQIAIHYSHVNADNFAATFVDCSESDEHDIETVCGNLVNELDSLADYLAPGRGKWQSTLLQQSACVKRVNKLLTSYLDIFDDHCRFNDDAYKYGTSARAEICPEFEEHVKQECQKAIDEMDKLADRIMTLQAQIDSTLEDLGTALQKYDEDKMMTDTSPKTKRFKARFVAAQQSRKAANQSLATDESPDVLEVD